MTSPDENAATEKNNKESFRDGQTISERNLHRTAFALFFIMLSFMQCKELTRIHQ